MPYPRSFLLVYKDGQIYSQSYKIGKPDEPVKVIGECSAEKHGTKVTFHPDPTILRKPSMITIR